MTTPKYILKRNNVTLEDFNDAKIFAAIDKASAHSLDAVSIAELVTDVVDSLYTDTVKVEDVQDAVEAALMRRGYTTTAKAFILYRQERAEKRMLKPDPKAISDYIHASKYARYLPELQRRETYEETVSRVESMHLRRFPGLEKDIRWAFDLVRQQRVLPSMRSMQFAGEAIEKTNLRIFNCSFSLVDRPRVFAEALYLLLCGCGTGYSVQTQHVEKLPAIGFLDRKRVTHHTVEDSIEGWADALDSLIKGAINGVYVEFAYYNIRPAGSPLKTSGGRAPGHLKLKESLERIRGVLEGAQGRKLRPIECHRILCHAADAVLSGGIRRSAMIALFSLHDEEMLNAKTGNWWERDPWFANANNSVALLRGEVKEEDFKRVFEMTRQWGEPGFFFTNLNSYGTNPCFHPDTKIWTWNGQERIQDLVGKSWVYVATDSGVGKGDEISPNAGHGYVTFKPATAAFLTQENAEVFELETEAGHFLTVTAEHEFPTYNGRVKLKDLKVGDLLLTSSGNSRVKAIRDAGRSDVYCLTQEETNTVIANGVVTGQCAEIGLNPKLGEATGWAFCNLVEINGAKLNTPDDFMDAAQAGAIIGTLQASYTDMPYLGATSEALARREALLGIGITGMMDSPDIALDAGLQSAMATYAVDFNRIIAEEIGINPAARVTCIKPSGTTSLELGSVGSGIHPHHAKRYIRRVTADELEPVFQAFREKNPHMCVRKPDGKWVIEFAVEAPEGAIVKGDLSAIEFLELVKSTQQNWVIPGTADSTHSPGLTHNVSNTVIVKPDEWDAVADYLWQNKDYFTGVSLLPSSGDKDYAFSPMEAVTTEADEARWNEIVRKYQPLNYESLVELDDTTNLTAEAACAGGACEVT